MIDFNSYKANWGGVMELSGRCYCGDIQYEIDGKLQASFQCHCRECQYITGGNANTVMVFSEDDLSLIHI